MFLRDTTQWTQLLLLGALVVVYLYNFRVLDLQKIPMSRVYLQNLLSFLNMGLAGFVVSAVAIRFVFPAVSIEGKSFWLVRSAPISIKRLLWSKFWMYLAPLLLLSEILIILSNWFLNVSGFMMGLSVITMVFLTAGIVGLGIGLGAIYPRFSVENVAKIATGYGAILYMILAMGFIALAVFLEAWPVNTILMAYFVGVRIHLLQSFMIVGSLLLVAMLSLAVCILPMVWGARHLETSLS
jgi:ABC-2 type transport system permease protein